MRVRTVALVGLGGLATTAASAHRRARRAAKIWQPPAGVPHRAGALAVRTLGDTGSPVVLLHGLVASGMFWGAVYDRLAEHHRLVVPDLLGFGGSDRPAHGYGPDDHVEALLGCLDALGIDTPVTIGAHSLGCLIALRMASSHPRRVAGVVGFGPPLYANRVDASARIGASGPMARLFALPGPVAKLACGWLCDHHAIATRLAVLTHPRLPEAVAADAVEHSWTSYSMTMTKVILDAGGTQWLGAVDTAVQFIAGDRDRVVDRRLLVNLQAAQRVTVQIWPGRHDLPLVNPVRCATRIADFAVTQSSSPGG